MNNTMAARYLLFFMLFIAAGRSAAAVDPPELLCASVNVLNGRVTLSWVVPPDPSNEFMSYEIYSSAAENSGYSKIHTETNYSVTSYVHNIDARAVPQFYYIITEYKNGTDSSYSAPSDTVRTIIRPRINYITVDSATGFPYMCWSEDDTSIAYYSILYYDPSQQPPWKEVIKVNPPATCVLLDGQDPCEIFRLQAYDNCNNSTEPTDNVTAICLNAQFSGCSNQVELKWNNYINWPNGVERHEIWRSDNGAAFTLVGSVSGSDTIYIDNVQPLINYRYYIKALESNSPYSSSSTIASVYTAMPELPEYIYLQYATVKNKESIEISFIADNAPAVTKYRIERQDSLGTTSVVAEIPKDQLTDGVFIYVDDSLINTSKASYTYKVVAIDICGNAAVTSNKGSTIFLKGSNNPDERVNTLNWNPYTDWDGNVQNYFLYRKINGVYDAAPAATIAGNNISYVDYLDPHYISDGEFCYYIEAQEAPGAFNTANISRSNEICLVQPPNVYLPNAFTPEGLNPVFKPASSYVDYDNYHLRIFNRWGQMVYNTTDPLEGWDGTVKGSPAPAGVYVYRLNYNSSAGKEFEHTGTVTLIR